MLFLSMNVSMPSTGGTSFLPEEEIVPEDKPEDVSMPSTGGTSFLPPAVSTSKPHLTTSVNALNGRDLISTMEYGKDLGGKSEVCQCPQRAGPHFYIIGQ